MRWFLFDEGTPVEWRIQAGGQPGYTQNQSIAALKAGLNAWNGDGGSNVDYRYAGTTNSTVGFSGCSDPDGDCTDGLNALIFDDADGSINDPFDCSEGGTLAIGGPWFDIENARTFKGQSYWQIVEADIITNENISCYLTSVGNPQRALEQLFAHELGHTLGFDHSCDEDTASCPSNQLDALMYYLFHQDNRGAVLSADDRNAVRTLYPGGAVAAPPAAPSDLMATIVGTHEVQLTWTDNANNESGFVLQGTVQGGTYADLGSLPPNTTAVEVSGLDDDTVYDFRVRAYNAAGTSAFSNVVEITTDLDIPEAPTDLTAAPASSTSVALTWEDQSDNETEFVVEARSPASGEWTVVQSGVVSGAAGGATGGTPAAEGSGPVTTVVGGLTTGVPYAFRVTARNDAGDSAPSNVAAATPLANTGACDDSGDAICLLGDRFMVSVAWRNQATGVSGTGHGAVFPQSDRSGTFWFFNAQNVELVVKVLDGSTINDFYWTFYGSLTDREYWITVVDTVDEDRASRTYYNPPGNDCGRFDTTSIPASDQPVEGGSLAALPLATPAAGAAATGTCVEDETTVCLLDGRFAVQVDWTRPNATTGVGHRAEGTGSSQKTGYFWFFNPVNVELVVKALDGTAVNGYFWFFYGSLSDVEYHITVTDTTSGMSRVYDNAQGDQCGQFDTRAFTPDGEVPPAL